MARLLVVEVWPNDKKYSVGPLEWDEKRMGAVNTILARAQNVFTKWLECTVVRASFFYVTFFLAIVDIWFHWQICSYRWALPHHRARSPGGGGVSHRQTSGPTDTNAWFDKSHFFFKKAWLKRKKFKLLILQPGHTAVSERPKIETVSISIF